MCKLLLRDYNLQTGDKSTANVCFVFGEIIQKARSKAGITQEELAQRARLTREYISLLEHDKRTPTITVFIRVTRALALSPADVIQQVEKSLNKK